MARFGWYAVERNHLYSIVNSPNKYIIHTSITGSALNYSLIYDISCKLFIEKTKHDCLPQDPLLWDRVPVRFTPTRNNPEFVIFKFGSETVKAWLPKEVYDVHVCVLKKQAFILSCQRMAHFQSILAQESLSLCDMYFLRSGENFAADVNNLGSEWMDIRDKSKFIKRLSSLIDPSLVDQVMIILRATLSNEQSENWNSRAFPWFSAFYKECVLQALTEKPELANDPLNIANLCPLKILTLVSPNWLKLVNSGWSSSHAPPNTIPSFPTTSTLDPVSEKPATAPLVSKQSVTITPISQQPATITSEKPNLINETNSF